MRQSVARYLKCQDGASSDGRVVFSKFLPCLFSTQVTLNSLFVPQSPQLRSCFDKFILSSTTAQYSNMTQTDSTTGNNLLPQQFPPSEPGKAYTLQSLCGEIIYIPCSKSAMRLLVTGKETENAFALVGTGGSESPPIGFHYHREAHDVFLCLAGSINVWAGDQCRTMNSGDFASVPPVSSIGQPFPILG